MKAVLIRTAKGLRGSTTADHEAWTKFRRQLETMPEGRYLRVEWSRPRNGPHHRKFMALLQLVTENSETYDTIEKALVAVKLCTGYADPHLDPRTGELVQTPRSIAFESMDQDAFEAFYSAAIDGVLRFILPQLSAGQADRLLDMIISGWA